MNKKDLNKLQRLIDRAAATSTAQYLALRELANFEQKHWGFEHGDRDLDEIIDSVCGGCGVSSGMSAEEFAKYMDSVAEKDD